MLYWYIHVLPVVASFMILRTEGTLCNNPCSVPVAAVTCLPLLLCLLRLAANRLVLVCWQCSSHCCCGC